MKNNNNDTSMMWVIKDKRVFFTKPITENEAKFYFRYGMCIHFVSHT